MDGVEDGFCILVEGIGEFLKFLLALLLIGAFVDPEEEFLGVCLIDVVLIHCTLGEGFSDGEDNERREIVWEERVGL